MLLRNLKGRRLKQPLSRKTLLNNTGSQLERAQNQQCEKLWDKKQEGKAQAILVFLRTDTNCQKYLAQDTVQIQNFRAN